MTRNNAAHTADLLRQTAAPVPPSEWPTNRTEASPRRQFAVACGRLAYTKSQWTPATNSARMKSCPRSARAEWAKSVALKILPAEVANDPIRRQRLELEARDRALTYVH